MTRVYSCSDGKDYFVLRSLVYDSGHNLCAEFMYSCFNGKPCLNVNNFSLLYQQFFYELRNFSSRVQFISSKTDKTALCSLFNENDNDLPF